MTTHGRVKHSDPIEYFEAGFRADPATGERIGRLAERCGLRLRESWVSPPGFGAASYLHRHITDPSTGRCCAGGEFCLTGADAEAYIRKYALRVGISLE
jgi:hypothetical protein